MCRNIKTLYNLDPPATDEEVRASALQYVRKISGFHTASVSNQAAFDAAVDAVTAASQALLTSLTTAAAKRTRESKAKQAPIEDAASFGSGE